MHIQKLAVALIVASMLAAGSLQSPGAAQAESKPSKTSTLTGMSALPVREVTIFKDGHALVTREGKVAIDGDGNATIGNLPRPVLGTFFPYSPDHRIAEVRAGRKKFATPKTSLTIPEMLAANIGKSAQIELQYGEGQGMRMSVISGRLARIPERSGREVDPLADDSDADLMPGVKSDLIEIETDHGMALVPMHKIVSVIFKDSPADRFTEETVKDYLQMHLAGMTGGAGASDRQARVGIMYVERGLRWLPSYRLSIDGNGKAHMTLQATLINDLIDLADVSTNLVIGVPNFQFKDSVDPIALGRQLARVAESAPAQSYLRYANNAIASQVIAVDAATLPGTTNGAAPEQTADGLEGSQNEDLFVFHLDHVSCKKGERLVVPVQQYDLDYSDLYQIDLAAVPPNEVQANGSDYKIKDTVRVSHELRLANSSKQPFTTAPILIEKSNRVIAQSLMRYTNPGSEADLTLTDAVNVRADKQEQETAREMQRDMQKEYVKISLAGKIEIKNLTGKTIDLEIKRRVLGTVDKVPQGKAVMLDYHNWPQWWSLKNGMGECRWQIKLQANETRGLDYTWHYFWK